MYAENMVVYIYIYTEVLTLFSLAAGNSAFWHSNNAISIEVPGGITFVLKGK